MVSLNAFSDQMAPPVAKKIPHIDNFFEDPRVDNYRWMHDSTNIEVKKHLLKENSYGEQFIKKNSAIQKNLQDEYKRLRSTYRRRIKYIYDNFRIYTKRNIKENYDRWLMLDIKTGQEILLLDENLLAKKHSYFEVYDFSINPSKTHALVLIDIKGRGHLTPFVLDLKTKIIKQRESKLIWGERALWINDEKLIVLCAKNEMESYQPYEYEINTKKETLLQNFLNQRAKRSIYATSDNEDVLLVLKETLKSTTYRYNQKENKFVVLGIAKKEEVASYDKIGDQWYKVSNIDSKNNDLFQLKESKWEKIYTPLKGNIKSFKQATAIPAYYIGKDYLVVEENLEAMSRFVAIDLNSLQAKKLMDYELVTFKGQKLKNIDGVDSFFFEETGFIKPTQTLKIELASQVKTIEIPSGVTSFNSELYETLRISIQVRDGKNVPVSLVYRKDLIKSKNNYMNFYGYGAYGAVVPYRFLKSEIPLLDRGIIYVMVHVRGGGEKGKSWHDQGRVFNKMNTFYDFIDVVEHFVGTKMTNPKKVSIEGRSAGGLLMGTVLNLRPELFKVAKVGVPFVDVLNTMTLYYDPLAKYERNEWGDGLIKEQYEMIKSYDPYTNIKNKTTLLYWFLLALKTRQFIIFNL